jgi:nicotinamidase-related amidase
MRWDAAIQDLPRLSAAVELDPTRTALVIVDMQNRAVKPDDSEGLARILREDFPSAGAYYLDRLRTVVPNNELLLTAFRDHGLRVVFLTVGPWLEDGSDLVSSFAKGYDEIEGLSGKRSLFPVGTREHRVIDELEPRSGELVINKTSSSPFTTTSIDLSLRQLGIDTLVCTGVVTDACVATTARDASDHGYKVAIVEDACAAIEPDMHDAALRSHAVWAGVVKSTADIVSSLER